jgi:MFS family permease
MTNSENTQTLPTQYKLTGEQKSATAILSIGTFLEYFDLMLYVHMSVLLNELFFPKADAESAKLISAFTFCLTFVFRPVGALLFGWLGDKFGRKHTVIVTTLLMALSCFVMTQVQTYAQIGIAASWIVSICRVVQGMASMGEIMGAEIYLTESLKPPIRYPAVGAVVTASKIGGTAALLVASFVMFYGSGWRSAFAIGCGVAIIGIIGRIGLRETQDFVDAKRRVKNAVINVGGNIDDLKNSAPYNHSDQKNVINFTYVTLIGNLWPLWFYINYMYAGNILKSQFGFSAEEVISNNMIVSFVDFGVCALYTYLSYRIHPLKILKITTYSLLLLSLLYPFLLSNCQSASDIFWLQAISVILAAGSVSSYGSMIPHFYVFKRFTYISLSYAMSRALMYVISSFGFVILVDYFGNIGMLIIIIPVMIAAIFGINHFIALEKKAGYYDNDFKELKSE